MNRRDNFRRKLGRQKLAALARDAKRWTKDCLTGCRSKRNNQARPNESQFGFEPRPARCHLTRIWFLMNATLAARFPFEIFPRVRDVTLFAIDSRFFERAIHVFPRRPDERFPGQVFVISRL